MKLQFADCLFGCRMSRPPIIRTKAEVQAKLSLLEVCVGVDVSRCKNSV